MIAANQAGGLPAHDVSRTQGKFLHLLARIHQARSILEIGTLGGYSTIWLARALPPEGKAVSLEINPGHAQVALSNLRRAGLASRVEVRVGPALESRLSATAIQTVGSKGYDGFALALVLPAPVGAVTKSG